MEHRNSNSKVNTVLGSSFLTVFLVTFLVVMLIGGVFLLVASRSQNAPVSDAREPVSMTFESIPESNVASNAAVTDEESITKAVTVYEEDEDYTHVISAADPDSVTIGFAGDILFDTNYAAGNAFKIAGNTAEGVIGQSLLERMRSADIMMVNNEFPYSYNLFL